MNGIAKNLTTLIMLIFIYACSGGNESAIISFPSITFTTPSSTKVVLGTSVTLTWSSTNSSSCEASGAWTGTKAVSGNEDVVIDIVGDNTFTIRCSGNGNTSTESIIFKGYRMISGVVVDGYISGAEVFIDTDGDWIKDSYEDSADTDNNGEFSIPYSNGNLVSIGGTDLDSQTLLDNLLITHKLTGHSNFKAVTPVTSVAAFMSNIASVNAALGIDSTIDIAIFDPVANKGDGGINDYFYEKGNQLTVLAYALQNVTNNLNTTTETTQDYFKAITEEIEKEYTETLTKVDIETEAFVSKVFDNVITAKSVTIDETAKINTTKALAGVLRVIEVKSSDDLTTGVIRFAVSTLQMDIQAIANGTATAETINSYTEDVLAYIAEDQNIDADEITPDISAIADSAMTSEDTAIEINILLNDSYLTSSHVSVSAGNGSNGTTSLASNIVTYDPDSDYNGTDTFTYTITQGDKTSSADVTVTIEAVNDEPSIDIASTIQVAENQTAVTTVSTSDVDEDELTLTLGGTDADSFNLSDDNVLTLKEAPDYETKDSYSITLTLTDGTETVTKDITIAITNVNDVAPEFTSEATFSAAENQTAIGTVTATDAEGDDVTFIISGDDLAITSAGVLTFVEAPDYETKTSYTATVTASDGTNSTTQDITVNITDMLENSSPIITNLKPEIELQEEDKKVLYRVEASDPEGDQIYFNLGGNDASKFEIDSSGLLSFKEVPDYENPSDSDVDNIYELLVSVTDSNASSNQLAMNQNSTKKNSTNQGNNTVVRVTNYDEDIISFALTGDDGTASQGPKIYIDMDVDSYTEPKEIQVLLWRGERQYWTSATAVSEENFIVDFNYTFNVPTNSPSGTWEIRIIRLITEDNEYNYSKALLDNKGFTTSVFLYNPNSDNNDPELISFDNLKVIGIDSDPLTNITVSMNAKVTDQENGLDTAFSYFMGPGGATVGDYGSVDTTTSPNSAVYEWILDPKTASGQYKIADLRFSDKAGNNITYLTSELEAYGNPYITITNPIGDNDTPQLSNFKLSGSVDGIGRKTITLRTLIDNGEEQATPIKRQYLRIIGPDGSIDKDSFLQQADGWWELSFELGLEAQDGDYNVSYWFIRDNALNNNQLLEADLKNRGFSTKLTFDGDTVTVHKFLIFTSGATFNIDENQTDIGAITAINTDGKTITYSITGSDITINPSTGVIAFASAPDYENKSSYTAIVTASDGTNTTTQDITVSINNLNDNSPSFTSSPTFTAAENQTAIDTVTAFDADGDTLVFSITGSEIQTTSNGTLSFISIPDYETKNSYSATVSVTDGVYQQTQDIVVNITDLDDTFSFEGKTIDGYISGANVFIDQNYNFKLDSGELTSTTDNAGSFVIATGDQSLFNCLKDRPIVANVPVGAIDSTLGEVTKAYQMILPSINETGSSSIIISPFSSLLGKAILKGKQSSELKEDLTVSEGCSSEGDDVASQVSTALEALYSDISNNFGIDKNTLLSDFILNPSSNISENIAQNIASLFPYTKQIDNQISDFLTERFEKEIRANVALSEDALDIIFGDSDYDKLPLSFSSRYETEKNSSGWFQTEELSASNGFISDTGVLSREHCSETDTVGCNLTNITLENIANTSTQYRKTSNFLNPSISISELKAGSLAVTSNDSRSWRDGSIGWDVDNSRARECQSSDDIQFQVTGSNKLLNFHYSSYSQGYMQFDCSTYRKYYYPRLNVSTIMDQSINDNSIQVNYYIPDVIRSGVVSNPPFDFVENRLTIDPAVVIKEMATLPTFYSQLNTIRRKFIGEEYLLFEYHHDPYITYFEMGTFPRNDMYWDQEILGDNRLYGQEARDAFFEKLKSEVTFDSEVFGTSAPINSSVLGRIAESYLEIVDYDTNNDAITLPVYPTYTAATKTLNMSLVNSELNLANLKDFIKNGINGKPITANIYYNPDDSIGGTVPVALYLYKGNDTNLDSGEAYFSIEFNLKVSSSQGSAENPYHRTGIQTFEIEKDAVIVVKYVEDEVTIERNIINLDSDKIVLEDQMSGSSPIIQPATLEVKVLNLINKVSNSIGGIQSFFDEGGEYTYKLDLGTGGFSLVDHSRNTIDFIEGTFKVSENPSYAINANDIIVHEGKTENLCFTRPSAGDLSSASFNLSFTERDRPGRGALADDFELSSSVVNFDQGDTQSCVVVTGVLDKHFDWGHDAYIDISSPSNGQKLSRNQIKIRIVDYWGAWNRISFKNR